ncbi:unnamed protein product [Cunninghamella blakesleeana]
MHTYKYICFLYWHVYICIYIFFFLLLSSSFLLSFYALVPLTTYFMDGEIQLPNTVQERVDNYEGEVSENLYYLGKKGIMTTAQGLKIAFLSGLFEKSDQMDIDNKNEGKEEENNNTMNGEEEINKYKPAYYHRSDIEQLKNTKFPLTIPYGVDILLTTEWPKEIENKSTIPFETASKKKIETSNSNISELTLALKPRYHFATSENMFYEREPYDNIMGFGGSSERPATHVSRFIGLGKAFNKEKQRWFYAYNIVPLTKATPEVLNMRPSNTTECPFWSFIKSKLSSHAGQKRSAAEDYSNFFWGDNPQSKKRGGLPPNYVCKICQGTDHFIKDCPHKEKSKDEQLTPPEGYVCKICQGTNHFIKDCPHKEKSRHEKSKDEQLTPPEGYVCKICQKTGHFIKDCPNRFQKPDLSSCWFCLSNPKIEKHLITSIGSEIYATLAKGPLISPANSPVPGGGHILLITITHFSNFGIIPDEDRKNIDLDLNNYKKALKAFYAKYDQDMVTFQISRESKRGLNHSHIQVLPIPKNKSSDIIEQVAKEEAEKANYDLIEGAPPSGDKAFFDMELPNGKHLVHVIHPKERFNLQFGRAILAKALDTPDREDWKACAQTEDEEKQAAKEFKKAFRPFDFTL